MRFLENKILRKLLKIFYPYFVKNSNVFGITILTYHGIVNDIIDVKLQRNFHKIKEFEAQISFLKRKKFKFLNATEFVYYIENPDKVKKQRMVFVTFDDGYKNNLKAIEVLKKYQVSATFFISTACIGSDISIWTVNLSLLLLKGKLTSLKFQEIDYSLLTSDLRLQVFNKIRNILKKVNSELRNKLYESILRQYPRNELQNLISANNYFEMLNWNEIQAIQSENIQFHSHGHFHEIHNGLQTQETLFNEIVHSKHIIEEKLNQKVFLFAFPNGDNENNTLPLLIQNGFEGAFVLGDKKFTLGSNKYNIPRITPNRKFNKFKTQINKTF